MQKRGESTISPETGNCCALTPFVYGGGDSGSNGRTQPPPPGGNQPQGIAAPLE